MYLPHEQQIVRYTMSIVTNVGVKTLNNPGGLCSMKKTRRGSYPVPLQIFIANACCLWIKSLPFFAALPTCMYTVQKRILLCLNLLTTLLNLPLLFNQFVCHNRTPRIQKMVKIVFCWDGETPKVRFSYCAWNIPVICGSLVIMKNW